MNAWEAIFAQSPANEGYYDEDELPHQHWNWPKETWFQTRLYHTRSHQIAFSAKFSKRTPPTVELPALRS